MVLSVTYLINVVLSFKVAANGRACYRHYITSSLKSLPASGADVPNHNYKLAERKF